MAKKIKCCHGCTERWVTTTSRCHATCKRYLDECAELEKKNHARQKTLQEERDADGVLWTGRERVLRRASEKVGTRGR